MSTTWTFVCGWCHGTYDGFTSKPLLDSWAMPHLGHCLMSHLILGPMQGPLLEPSTSVVQRVEVDQPAPLVPEVTDPVLVGETMAWLARRLAIEGYEFTQEEHDRIQAAFMAINRWAF